MILRHIILAMMYPSLGSLMAIMTSIVGLHFGLVLVRFVDHKERIRHWMTASILLFFLALLLTFLGVPLNKSLYTTSYMLLTSATAGLLYCAIYLLIHWIISQVSPK
ncbi:hypothetical protein AMTRI_Chr09g18070 [Amborella trichopoda]